MGVIDIAGSPIRWVNVKKSVDSGLGIFIISFGTLVGGGSDWYTEYGVPDPRIGPTFPNVQIKTVRVKRLPLIGKAVDLRWKGDDFGLRVMDRLSSDRSISQPIMDSYGLEVRAHSGDGCWILTTGVKKAPPRKLWDCYQAIAHHLLATPIALENLGSSSDDW